MGFPKSRRPFAVFVDELDAGRFAELCWLIVTVLSASSRGIRRWPDEGAALVPIPVEVLGREPELDDEVVGKVFRLGRPMEEPPRNAKS
jgi:hypothetical protein